MTLNLKPEKEALIGKVMDWWDIVPQEVEKNLKADHNHDDAILAIKRIVEEKFNNCHKVDVAITLIWLAVIVFSIIFYLITWESLIFLISFIFYIIGTVALRRIKIFRNYEKLVLAYSKIGCSFENISINIFLYSAWLFELPKNNEN